MNLKQFYTGRAIGFVIVLVLVVLAYPAWYSFDRFTKTVQVEKCNDILTNPPAPVMMTAPDATLAPVYSINTCAAALSGCDQSATTTDCSTLPAPSQPEQQPYVPPDPIQPSETWTSATGTPISLFGFSFELPAGWHGSVYSDAYLGNLHVLVQSDSNDRGFTIDCTPDGKGFEDATRLSSEMRSFTTGGTDYSAAFEKWTAPGN